MSKGLHDILISNSSPQQLADALIAKLSPRDDLRRYVLVLSQCCHVQTHEYRTRSEFKEEEVRSRSFKLPNRAHAFQLDCVEISLFSVSRSLNSVRNAFAPVNSLPRETLATIFAMVASSYTPSTSGFLPDFLCSADEASHRWINVAQVCRYWRETAFAFPTLWTAIDTSCPLASLAFLDRSCKSLLRVYLRDAVFRTNVKPSLERGRFLQAIAPHSEQFVELHVQPTYRYGPAILRFFDSPAPHLTSLSISLGMGEDQEKTLPILFGGQTPKLKHLTLSNFAKWHDSWAMGATLTHLCLYDQHIRARIPMDEFVQLLAGCIRLEELIAVEAGPSSYTATSSVNNVGLIEYPLLEMPRMRYLHIGNWSSPRLISKFLSRIVVPNTTKVEIWGDVLFHSSETLSALLPASLTHFHPLHNLKAVHLMYRPTLKDAPQLFSVSNGILVIHFYYVANTSSELLASVFSLVDVRNVQELTIGVDCDPDLTSDWWKDTFRTMSKLMKLNIIRRRSRAILSGLTTDSQGNDTRGPPAAVCPALSSLVITDDSALASIRLFTLAQERTSFGVPIRNLTIVAATPGLGYSGLNDSKLGEEMEDLRCHIADVQFARNDIHNTPSLPVGWPSEPFLWMMRRKDAKGSLQRSA